MSEIIAKAMNSTIGTSDFKAFDQLLLSHKSLVADMETVCNSINISVRDEKISIEEKNLATLTIPLDGSVYLQYKVGLHSQSSASFKITMKVYLNDKMITSIATNEAFPDSSKEPSTVLIQGKAGDIIRINYICSDFDSGKRVYVSIYNLLAKVVDCPSFL